MLNIKQCYSCSAEDFVVLYHINDCDISRCRRCGLVFSSSYEPFDQFEEYANYNDTQLIEKAERQGAHNFKVFKKYVPDFDPQDSLLDFGCGTGYFLSNFPNLENKAGYEISSYEAEHGRSRGLNVYDGRLEDLVATGRKFRQIVSLQVIEHLQDPVAILKQLAELLTDDGEIFLTTPNFKGITSRITRSRWLVLYPPLHLFYFDPSTIAATLQDSGFSSVRVRTENFDPYNILLMRRISPHNRHDAGQQMQGVKYGKRSLTRAALKIRDGVNHLIRLTPLGDNLIVQARKGSR